MDKRISRGFLLLVITQTFHSFEEYYFSLWAVFSPARIVSGFVSDNLPLGFSIINVTVVLFGCWTYFKPVIGSWPSASVFVGWWCVVELGNAVGHIIFAVQAQGYFPGIYTAPFLLLFSSYIIVVSMLSVGEDRAAT